jgi:flagellar motor protein MotB
MIELKLSCKIAMTMFVLLALLCGGAWLYAEPPRSPHGADAVPDLYAPSLAGPGGFITATGGAPASALNPAQGGNSLQMIIDAGYLAILPFCDCGCAEEYGQSAEVGALIPTNLGIFGGSLRYIDGIKNNQCGCSDCLDGFPIGPTFGGNFFNAKEVYPGMSLGGGLNFGFGEDWTLSANVGFHFNSGSLGFLDNVTWAFVMRSLGKSYFPTWLTAAGGVSCDFVRIRGRNGKPDPLALSGSTDIIIPSIMYQEYINMIFKTGVQITIAELITLSTSWPGASGLNIRELWENTAKLQVLPSVGLGLTVKSPSKKALKIDSAYKPLYGNITAVGAGASWYGGITERRPPRITVTYPQTVYFSTNYDGKSDYLEVPVRITGDRSIVKWMMEIQDEEGKVIRTIESNILQYDNFDLLTMLLKQIDIPPAIHWDGIGDSGEMSADGRYFFTITAMDNSGKTSVSPVYETVLKNSPPTISIEPLTDAEKLLNPGMTEGQQAHRIVTFIPDGSDEEAWESGIWNSAGVKIRTFAAESGRPSPRVWDGRDDAGRIAPDGSYSYRISATDWAQNYASAAMNNIVLDTREAAALLTSSVSAIAPKRDQNIDLVTFAVRLLLNDGIDYWKLELKDENGVLRRTFSGEAHVPAALRWNGLDELDIAREGIFTPELTVSYAGGDVIKAAAPPVTVDVSRPELSLAYSPRYFSPDNDGVNDELYVNLAIKDASPIARWSVEIREPESPNRVFRRIEGRGAPAAQLRWNGRSATGELVQSAAEYPYTFTAEDILGNSNTIHGKIGVDVLVIRDGDRLKIQIPSIAFRDNAADFTGLSRETVDNNIRILRRVAQILNRHHNYRVMVEGHVNPVYPPGHGHDREELDLRLVSEARARAVVDLLIRYGIVHSRLSYQGAGSLRPVASFEDQDNGWKNNRIEFILIKSSN